MARPRLHDDALRSRLLEAASETVSERGEAALTVRAVAHAAGTSASAVYALFGSRDDLLVAVSAEGFRRFAGHLDAAGRTDDPVADLRALGRAYRDSALADPHYYRVMFDRAVPPHREPGGTAATTQRAVDRPTFGVLRDAVARVLTASGGDTTRAEPVAIALWGMVHGLVSLELAGLLPGDEHERAARYDAAAGALGPALVAGDLSGEGPRGPAGPG